MKSNSIKFRDHTRWYKPEQHAAHLQQWIETTSATVQQIYSCIDVFSASERIAETFEDAMEPAIAFDIKLNREHDLTSEVGVKNLLRLALQSLVWLCLTLFVNEVKLSRKLFVHSCP